MQDLKAITTKAIETAGGGATLARDLGITRQAVYQWDRVPPQHVLDVERITGVSRYKLRPDLFGERREAAE
jgi:DNA-binding transcriptional regulator YdaS (Cro superfamily)